MLQEKPLVSVCMPCYNHEEFVGEAIQSVLGQTYSNLEVIIVDDVSTDNSVEVIKSFEDPRIRLTVMEKNTGFSAAEYMFEQAKGEFICWVDSDDMWEKTLLEKYIGFLQEHEEYGGCVCKPFVIDKDGHILEDNLFCSLFSGENMKKEECFQKIYLNGNYLCSSSMCIRKSLYEQVGEFRFQYKQIHDYEYWLRFLQVAELYMYPESLASYRVHWEGGNANFSTPSPEVNRREKLERTYILLEILDNLEEDFFIRAFSDLLRIQPGEEGFCLECEKFWIMKDCPNIPQLSAVFYYYRHYQNSNFKYYSKKVYGITNNMIYQMAGEENGDSVGNKSHDNMIMSAEAKTLLDGINFNPGNKPIIVWGAGKRTVYGLTSGLFNFSIEYIVDTDNSKKMLGQIKIVSPEDVKDWKNYYVIVTPKLYREYIFRVLSEKGLQYGKEYIGYEELYASRYETF